MNKFRINKPVSSFDEEKEVELQRFSDGADNHEIIAKLDKSSKPNKSFTIPINEYELDMLRKAAKKDDRSQRYIARKLLIESLKKYLSDT